MKVQMNKDHRGWETNEQYVLKGTVLDLPDKQAQALIDNGWAVLAGSAPKIEPEKQAIEEVVEEEIITEMVETEPVAVDVSGINAVNNTENYLDAELPAFEEPKEEPGFVDELEPLEDMTYNELRKLAVELGIKATGSKEDLIFKIELERD